MKQIDHRDHAIIVSCLKKKSNLRTTFLLLYELLVEQGKISISIHNLLKETKGKIDRAYYHQILQRLTLWNIIIKVNSQQHRGNLYILDEDLKKYWKNIFKEIEEPED